MDYKLAVLAGNPEFAEKIKVALAGLVLSNLTETFVDIRSDDSQPINSDLISQLLEAEIIALDWNWGIKPQASTLAFKENAIEPSNLPLNTALHPLMAQILSEFREKGANAESPRVIFLFTPHRPSVYLTGALLHSGVDWVWPDQHDFEHLERLVRRLLERKKSRSVRPTEQLNSLQLSGFGNGS